MTRLPVLGWPTFVVGAALMVTFEYTITRVLGLALLFFAIVAGVWAMAMPELLAEGDEASAASNETSSSPATDTTSPGCSWRPRRASGSPLTSTRLPREERLQVAAGVHDPGELEQLAEPDRVGPDRDLARHVSRAGRVGGAGSCRRRSTPPARR